MRKLYALLTLLLLSFALGGELLFAQSRVIIGKVVDDKGNPIPGASIMIKSSSRGTTTTSDGVFSISVPSSAKTFVVSSLNFTTTEVAIVENPSIVLKPSIADLDEVVVAVAYGSQKKTDVTGAISIVTDETIKSQQITTIGQALQGTAPGVNVVTTNGQPGENPIIRIRGIATIGADANPLFVVDGVTYDGNLNMINPNDIESFSILKDAVATSLYGSRGGNGVILITTKSGKRNSTPSISLSSSYGISSRAVGDYPYLNTQQQFQLGWEALRNHLTGSVPDPDQSAADNLIGNGFHYNPYGPSFPNPVASDGTLLPGAKLLWNDNWTKALTNNQAARKDVSLGISGGTEKSKYYFSAGYLDQQGYVSKSDYKRISTRLNYTTKLTDWFELGAKASLVSSTQNYPDQGSGNYADVIQYGRTMSSVFPIYARDENGIVVKDADGNPVFDYGKPNLNQPVNVNRPVLQPSNVVGTLQLDNWGYDRLLSDLNAYGQVNFTKDLYFRSSFGINRSVFDESHYENNQYGDAASVGGRIYREQDLTTSWTFTNTLGYSKHFGDHHIDAMIGYESYKYNYETIYGSKTGFAFNGQQQLSNASTNEDFEGYTVSSTLQSVLGRIKYDYQGKYFAEFTGRSDGSSIWAPGYRYGFFPAGGVAWLISKEDFMKSASAVNMLKLRASYGANGNNALLDGTGNRNYFPYLNTFASGNNDLTNSGVYLNQLANAQIKWEKQVTADIGFDFELLKSRLTGSLDFFQKNSLQLVLNQPLPPSSGFGSVLSNIGKVQNSGVELNLAYEIVRNKDFNWSVSANVSFLKNKIKELLPGVDTFASQGAFRNVVGKSVYEFYMPVWAGVDPATGAPEWWIDEKDANGNPTGKSITTTEYSTATSSEKWVGSGLPTYTGGFSTRLVYKAFDLSILFNYALGGKYYDNNYASLMSGFFNGYGAQLDVDQLQRWSKAGDKTNVPILNQDVGDAQQRSTRFLFSGDYLRLRNVTLGYTFDTKPIEKVVKGIRVYIQADNMLTWDKLKKGSDPETELGGDANGNAVVLKTVSFGIDFKF